MSNQPITLQLEIPSEVAQQDVWDFEEQLGQIVGITTELRDPKDPIAETLLFITVAITQTITVAGGINTLHDLAQHIYNFLHPKKQEPDHHRGKNKIVIITKRKRIELYNLSPEEIEKVLES